MKKKKNVTIVTTYSSDLTLVLNWLRLNKAISSVGERRKTRAGVYAVSVKMKKGSSKQKISNLVKDKFGVFAKVI
tara:strand:+ start:2805 stop:3029 length:225 start_codon:yes stop_codon:yes gene_type:complete